MKNIEDISSSSAENFPELTTTGDRRSFSLLGRVVKSIIKNIEYGAIKVVLPSGEVVSHFAHDNGPFAEIKFNNWRGLYKYITGGELAFAEAYMAGDVDIPRLSVLFKWFLLNEASLRKKKKRYLLKKVKDKFLHLILNDNSKSGSKKNIAFHYDLGNDFYAGWLDPSMTYSSADFSNHDGLEKAQIAKYQRISNALDIKDGDCILEIGCGWGGYGEQVLKNHDVDYKGITISQEQHDFALERLEPLSLRDKPIVFQDYRELKGQYDKIVSIEMFEAVGEKHWVTYFNKIRTLLKRNGKASIQVITINPERFERYRDNVDFIQKYTFPGGMLPTQDIFIDHANSAGLKVDGIHQFGKCYAETLRRWRDKFITTETTLTDHGLDDRFYRMWRYYLEYCEVGFDHGTIDVAQFTLSHK